MFSVFAVRWFGDQWRQVYCQHELLQVLGDVWEPPPTSLGLHV